jgi:uncharacterized protein involved in tellurium resistance
MIILKDKGEIANLEDSKSAIATLYWQTKVDLDLWCFFVSKGVTPPPNSAVAKEPGFFKKIFGGTTPVSRRPAQSEIGFSCRGNLNKSPFIKLDKDSGIGDKIEAGGFNEENIRFSDLSKVNYALICANIYGKNTNFSKYNGNVTIKVGNQDIQVPLTAKESGAWCAVALIDNSAEFGAKLININETQTGKPNLGNYINK